jgi:fatty-acyl-CoA synthase
VVVSGGENIYPAELEQVLLEIAGISDVAVVARPDEQWGEIPVAVIETRPGADLSSAAILDIFEGRLARYKHPREVVFVSELPRNVMGKVQKFKVRAMVSGQKS